jgi:hypothetical protein
MKHLQTFSLFESVNTSIPGADELRHALYETDAGKDLRALVSLHFLGPSSTHIRMWAATFISDELPDLGTGKFVAVEPVTREDGQLVWNYVFRSHAMFGPPARNSEDFTTVENCLRGLWIHLVTSICGQIFPGPHDRYEYASLVENNISLFEGHAYNAGDLKFLITHLKEILSSRVSPKVAVVLRQRFPTIWQTLNDNPGATTSADLGELGF